MPSWGQGLFSNRHLPIGENIIDLSLCPCPRWSLCLERVSLTWDERAVRTGVLMKKGLIQVYTGDGKGKTTAALGLALRAVGHDMKVLMIQFMKGRSEIGEIKAARKLAPYLTILSMGRGTFVSKENPDPEDIQVAREGFLVAQKAIQNREYDVVILDEINVAVEYGLISFSDLIHLLNSKPEEVEIVLTGRNARPELLERADLVTEMVKRKHYFDKGVPARKGMED